MGVSECPLAVRFEEEFKGAKEGRGGTLNSCSARRGVAKREVRKGGEAAPRGG